MKARKLAPVLFIALLLSSCSNPYRFMSGETQALVEQDILFLQKYKETFCQIKDLHSMGEISNGKCLALYYDKKDNDSLKDGKKEVLERINYILSHPGSFEEGTSERLNMLIKEISGCMGYLGENCM